MKTKEKSSPKKVDMKQYSDKKQQAPQPFRFDVNKILTTKYPLDAGDYAIQLFYKTKRNPNISVTKKEIAKDLETVFLTIDEQDHTVNIRTGKIY